MCYKSKLTYWNKTGLTALMFVGCSVQTHNLVFVVGTLNEIMMLDEQHRPRLGCLRHAVQVGPSLLSSRGAGRPVGPLLATIRLWRVCVCASVRPPTKDRGSDPVDAPHSDSDGAAADATVRDTQSNKVSGNSLQCGFKCGRKSETWKESRRSSWSHKTRGASPKQKGF